MRRFTIPLLLAMVVFGVGVNRYIAAHKSNLTAPPAQPTAHHAAFTLPGTIYVAQGGALYSLTGGTFTQLALPGGGLQWLQPHVLPDGTLLAVARGASWSDLYHIDGQGHVLAQLTHNHISTKTIQLNHWVWYPSVSADGHTVFASYDTPKPGYMESYQEDLSIWSGTMGKLTTKRWTIPDPYTGGDVQPQPLANGWLLYATYAIAPDNHVESVIGIQKTPSAALVPLTEQKNDCNSPAVSPDGTMVAMICTSDTQSAKLEVAHLSGGKLGTPAVIADNCFCSSPSWAPDGSGLLYIAPADTTGRFQLWWDQGAGTARAAAPKAVTDGIDLDALSAPAWYMQPAASPAPSP